MYKCLGEDSIHAYNGRYMKRMAVLVAAFVCFVPFSVDAAVITLDNERTEYSRFDTFIVPVRLDTEGECINAVSLTVTYEPTVVQVVDVARGSSILTLWPEVPTIDRTSGTVHFSGGVPGSYCGRVEGDPGLTNVVAELVVTGAPGAHEVGESELGELIIDVDASEVLQSDGNGTPARMTPRHAQFVLVTSSTTPFDAWQRAVKDDTLAPELFDIQLTRNPNVVSNKWFIVFGTTDKQSGIDHYEVLETDPDNFGFLSWLPRRSHWIVSESPYVLRDQRLTSKIMVRAVDKAGNERIVAFTPPVSVLRQVTRPEYLAILFLLATLIVIGVAIERTYRRRKRERSEAEITSYE